MGRIFRDEVNLSQSELPEDVEVVATRGNLDDEWFWVYFKSREFIDLDPDYDTIPEMTLWFGPRRK